MYRELFDLESQSQMTSFFYNDLSKLGKLKEIKQGEVIDPSRADEVYIVVEGYLKQFLLSVDGHERGLFRLSKGTIFGEMDFFDGYRTCVLTKALEDSAVSVIHRNILESELQKNPKIYQHFIHSIARKYRILMLFLADNTFNDSLGKLASILIRLGVMHDGEIKERTTLERIYTHEEFASVMGCSRITVTKGLNHFKKKKYISIENRRIVIEDVKGLQQYVKFIW